METGYSPKQYVNHPYWNTDEFQKGDICYNGFLYGDLQLRYDTYKKHLVVITPEKQIAVCVDMRKVDYFVIQGTLFVRRDDDFYGIFCMKVHICSCIKRFHVYWGRLSKKRGLIIRSSRARHLLFFIRRG